jgi:vancomycin resistance protein YoaR
MQGYHQTVNLRFIIFNMKKILQKNKVPNSIKKNRYLNHFIVVILLIVALASLSILYFNSQYAGRIFPNIRIASIDVGGLTPEESKSKLNSEIQSPEIITLTSEGKSFDINSAAIALSFDFNSSIDRAYNFPRSGNFFYDTKIRLGLLNKPTDLGLTVNYDETAFNEEISAISDEIETKPVYPLFKLKADTVEVEKGSPGTVVDINGLRNLISAELAFAKSPVLTVPTSKVDPSINNSQAEEAIKRASKYLNKEIVLEFEYKQIPLKTNGIIKMLKPAGGYNDQEISIFIDKVSGEIDRDPQDAKFQFDGSKVTEFAPALDGVKTDTAKLKELITTRLDEIEKDETEIAKISVPVAKTKPDVTIGEVNNLGIKELIGRGTSTYFHSIPGRVYNVNLAASRVNGAIVKPGETFSFNATLGDVSKLTGYKEAYIISNGKTILGDGGGVCQVSTTLFRAALNAGLPIDERSAHAYRVSYYEQGSAPGLDATVYSPRPDFKFTNNTDHHILIQAINDPKNYSLVFELYGTADGRVATISKPLVSNYQAPLPTIYQDDPTLPAGTLKQTDFAASGARVTFNYSVKKNGEEVYKKTFISNYRPWASVYLRGTGPSQ